MAVAVAKRLELSSTAAPSGRVAFESHYENNEGAQQYLYHGLDLRPRFHKATIVEENGTFTFIEMLCTEPMAFVPASWLEHPAP